MKIGQIKLLCYAVALVLVGLGAKDVLAYVEAKGVNLHEKVAAEVEAALSKVDRKPAERTGIVSYDEVKRGFHKFNWTGEPPPAVVKGPGTGEIVKPKHAPVSDLILVLMVRFDTDDADQSSASIIYKTAAKMPTAAASAGQDLKKGDTLLPPHDWAKVAKITPKGVEFEFEEEGRANETIAPPNTAESEIAFVGPDGVVRAPTPNSIIRQSTGNVRKFRPQTYERRPGEFRIGFEDQKEIGDNYPTILSQEIRHRRHRNPKTGQYDGIEIQSVTAGSFASRHGAQAGDIIRSINGHPVTSVAEAVSFVREHEGEYTTWEVEVENQGKIRTVTYESPPDN